MIINPFAFGGALSTYTLNPLDKSSLITLSNGNRTATKTTSSGHVLVRAVSGVSSGLWYWEVRQDTTMTNSREIAAITKSTVSTGAQPGSSPDGYGYNGINGFLYNNGSGAAFGATFDTGDVIGVAFDAGTGRLWFAKNNTWQASGNPAAGTSPAATLAAGTWFPTVGLFDNTGAATVRFAAVNQTYAPPAGFTAIG